MARKKRFLIDMKKFIFLFLGFSSLFFSCSSDSDSQPFDSTISIDGVVFVPKQITAYPSNSSVEKSTIFVLQKNVNTPTNLDEMVFRINYPLSQSNTSGTYLMTGLQGMGNYSKAENSYAFFNGSVTVEDLGNNKFNITFNNVKGTQGNGSSTVITISGNINGKFLTSN
jgi:hypothetical protein